MGNAVLVHSEGKRGLSISPGGSIGWLRVAGARGSRQRSLEMMWTEFLSPGERHRRDCSPTSVPDSLFVHYSFNKHVLNAYYVLGQALCRNLGVKQGTSQTHFLPVVGWRWSVTGARRRSTKVFQTISSEPLPSCDFKLVGCDQIWGE